MRTLRDPGVRCGLGARVVGVYANATGLRQHRQRIGAGEKGGRVDLPILAERRAVGVALGARLTLFAAREQNGGAEIRLAINTSCKNDILWMTLCLYKMSKTSIVNTRNNTVINYSHKHSFP